jgi:hypothetical protein
MRLNDLPTIGEDQEDDEVIDSNRLGLVKKKASERHIPKSVRNSQNYENKEQLLKQHRRIASNLVVPGMPPKSRERSHQANPRSADVHNNKAKAYNLKPEVLSSDQEDATTEATRVSSGQSQQRVAQKNLNA